VPRSDCDVLVVGEGVTLSWGCAREAAALVTRAL